MAQPHIINEDYGANNLERYARHIAKWGKEGQEKLNSSKVLVCGLGGLGSGVIAALGGYGVGKIGMLDFDTVQLSNLNRQFIHKDCNLGETKTFSAAKFLEEFNPSIRQVIYNKKLDETNLEDFAAKIKAQGFEIIVDCFDNFEGKVLLNSLASMTGVTLVHGGVEAFQGQVMTIKPSETACLACILGDFKELAHNDAQSASSPQMPPAALPSVVNTISAIQANECVKILLNLENILYNKLLRINLSKYEFKVVELAKNSKCKVCTKQEPSAQIRLMS